MPRFDGTGPQGIGPMTGKGIGFCVLKESKDKPGQAEGIIGIQSMPFRQHGSVLPYIAGRSYSRGFRGGFGRGRGFGMRGGGRSWRNRFYANL